MSKKRAFVRYSKQGKIVPGSLILTSGSYPSGPSTWKEVPTDLCCEFGCDCFEITAVWDGNNFKSLKYYDCDGNVVEDDTLNTGETITVCAQRVDEAWSTGYYTWVKTGACVATYECPAPVETTSTTTTTTVAPETTTTTTTIP